MERTDGAKHTISGLEMTSHTGQMDKPSAHPMLRKALQAGATGPAAWVATYLTQIGAAHLIPFAMSFFDVVVPGVGTIHAGLSMGGAAGIILLQTFAAASTGGIAIPVAALAAFIVWRHNGATRARL